MKSFSKKNYSSKTKAKSKTFYVVHKGHQTGIYFTWDECKKNVDKYEGAIFKKFTDEKEAIEFLKNGFGLNIKPKCVTRKENTDKKNIEKITDAEVDAITEDAIFIYTDGSCIRMNNGITIAGYGIYIPTLNISVSAPLLNQKLTNNRAEMTAIIESIKYLTPEDLTKKINILTDSQYSMYIFHGTGERYEKNNFKNNGIDVPNIDLIKELLHLKRTYNIDLFKVRAHTSKKDKHSINNDIVDKLATKGAFSTIKQNKMTSSIIFKNTNESTENNYTYDSANESTNDDSINESTNDSTDYHLNDYIDSDSDNDNNNNNNNNKYIPTVPIKKNKYKDKSIDKHIQMNELFEFDELDESDDINLQSKSLKCTRKSNGVKTLKLSNWFIQKKNTDNDNI